jgi:hypothetical protein
MITLLLVLRLIVLIAIVATATLLVWSASATTD